MGWQEEKFDEFSKINHTVFGKHNEPSNHNFSVMTISRSIHSPYFLSKNFLRIICKVSHYTDYTIR